MQIDWNFVENMPKNNRQVFYIKNNYRKLLSPKFRVLDTWRTPILSAIDDRTD